MLWSGSARAQQNIPDVARSNLSPPTISAKSWVLMDQHSGWVLASSNPDLAIEPASLSKLMTAYVVFDELRKGNLALNTPVHISETAWRTEGSRMFAKLNSSVSVEELIQGLIVQSGNDAAVALAEHIAGSEQAFADRMNAAAAAIGLSESRFQNSTGLPAEDHYSTARDLSTLVRVIVNDFPEYYRWYSQKEFTYNDITQRNRNVLLWRDESVDGVKTGHTSSAGYCLIGSAQREGMRLISTVIGTESPKYRAEAVHSLLKFGFATYDSRLLYSPTTAVLQVNVFKGTEPLLPVVPQQAVGVALPRGSYDGLEANVTVGDVQVAPVAAGQPVGSLNLAYKGTPLSAYPLVAARGIGEGPIWRRVVDGVRLWFQ